MRTPSPAIRGATTSLGFAPALVFLLVPGFLFGLLGVHELGQVRVDGRMLIANPVANGWLFLGLAAVYAPWLVAVTCRWTTAATGGGFAVAGTGLVLRIVVELPQVLAQTPLAERAPPEPFATVLPLARGLGIAAYAFGLACVLAACLSERRLRARGPAWTLPR